MSYCDWFVLNSNQVGVIYRMVQLQFHRNTAKARLATL